MILLTLRTALLRPGARRINRPQAVFPVIETAGPPASLGDRAAAVALFDKAPAHPPGRRDGGMAVSTAAGRRR